MPPSAATAFVTIQQALELDHPLDCTEQDCDELFDALKPEVNRAMSSAGI